MRPRALDILHAFAFALTASLAATANAASGIEDTFAICGDAVVDFDDRAQAFEAAGWVAPTLDDEDRLIEWMAQARVFATSDNKTPDAEIFEMLKTSRDATRALVTRPDSENRKSAGFIKPDDSGSAVHLTSTQSAGNSQIGCSYVSNSGVLALQTLLTITGHDTPVRNLHAKVLPLESRGAENDLQTWSTASTFVFPNSTYLRALLGGVPPFALAVTMTTKIQPK